MLLPATRYGATAQCPKCAQKLHWHAAGPWVHTVNGSTRCPDDPRRQPPGSPDAWTPDDLEALRWLIQNLAGWWG